MRKIVTAMAASLLLGIAHAAPPGNVPTAPTGPIPPVNPMPAGPTQPNTTSALAGPKQRTSTALTADDVNAWLDGYLPYALHTADIAGAVVAVVKDGQVLTERGYGYADVAARTPVDPKLTLFRPGSVSKLVTWTAVMQLVEQGKIDLDADVNGYLDFKIPARDGKPVTMRNLMQHVAGFEEQAKGIISEDPKAPGFEVLLKQWVPAARFRARGARLLIQTMEHRWPDTSCNGSRGKPSTATSRSTFSSRSTCSTRASASPCRRTLHP